MSNQKIPVLAIERLLHVQDHQGPFALNPDFNPGWWNRPNRHRNDESEHDDFSFHQKNVEVARACINPSSRIVGAYVGFSAPRTSVEVVFIEVGVPFRRKRVGSAVLEHLIGIYYPAHFFAFSKDADHFWRDVGWNRQRRRDERSSHYPLFTLD